MSKELKVADTGFVINIGNTYRIGPKADSSANEALKRLRTTKLPNESGVDLQQVPYDEASGVYDTGLYPYSKSLSGLASIEEAEGITSILEDKVVKPLERLKGPKALDHIAKDGSFWDSYTISIYNGRVLDTNNPQDLMELYHMILYGYACPKGREYEYNSENSRASYTFEDVQKDRKLSDEKNSNKIKAAGLYYTLHNQQEKLDLVTYKLGMPTIKDKDGKINIDVLNNLFQSKQDGPDSYDFNLDFIAAAEKVGTKKGVQELTLYKKIDELFKAGLITKDYDTYNIGELSLGKDLDAAIAYILRGDYKSQVEAINKLHDDLTKNK